ncbi:MAG TPA: transporter [Bradyrhizobium sp.]|nr:transporter [Bradyrhizobium sp.]
MRKLILGVAGSLGFYAASSVLEPARAQTADKPAPDKSQYWLLNPVPDDLMRSFSTDRPTKSNVPFTVDAGHFQYEMDLFNFSSMKSGTVRTETWLVPNPTLKVGLTSSIDLEINMAPFVSVHSFDSATATSSTIQGTDDLFARMKINLWGNDGGPSAFALIPYVKAPTAPVGIGNGATEGGVIAPLSLSLPKDFTLLINSEVDALKDNTGSGYHTNFLNLVNLSRPIVKDVTLYVELWSDVNNDPTGRVAQYSFDTALAWTVKPNFQIDVGANFGLNRATPAVQLYVGAAQRF